MRRLTDTEIVAVDKAEAEAAKTTTKEKKPPPAVASVEDYFGL